MTHITRLGKTAELMAFRYLLMGDEESADLAIESVSIILKFKHWDIYRSRQGETLKPKLRPLRTPGT